MEVLNSIWIIEEVFTGRKQFGQYSSYKSFNAFTFMVRIQLLPISANKRTCPDTKSNYLIAYHLKGSRKQNELHSLVIRGCSSLSQKISPLRCAKHCAKQRLLYMFTVKWLTIHDKQSDIRNKQQGSLFFFEGLLNVRWANRIARPGFLLLIGVSAQQPFTHHHHH